ncbi:MULTISPECIES: YkoP family protein [Bacillus]|uniref:YkoP-like domain-containing protein n=1 Tax=Bacillus capparidis TaxID=1840411 RepID=A0ABS4CPZ9_9BACI|nr:MULTISPECIES: hypothetical protein [Bacillus]MBP1079654.1 hypothetical protein [Bacillus capparidis]
MLRIYLVSIWSIIDPVYYLFTRLRCIQSNDSYQPVFRVRLTKYKGKDVCLPDGTKICKNDMLLKVHLHNVRLLRETLVNQNQVMQGRYIYKRVKQSMPYLAMYINNHKDKSMIKGIIGITLINKGIKNLGFECFEPENKFYKWFKKISLFPIYLLSTNTASYDMKKHKLVYLMMSKNNLLSKYLNEDIKSQ